MSTTETKKVVFSREAHQFLRSGGTLRRDNPPPTVNSSVSIVKHMKVAMPPRASLPSLPGTEKEAEKEKTSAKQKNAGATTATPTTTDSKKDTAATTTASADVTAAPVVRVGGALPPGSHLSFDLSDTSSSSITFLGRNVTHSLVNTMQTAPLSISISHRTTSPVIVTRQRFTHILKSRNAADDSDDDTLTEKSTIPALSRAEREQLAEIQKQFGSARNFPEAKSARKMWAREEILRDEDIPTLETLLEKVKGIEGGDVDGEQSAAVKKTSAGDSVAKDDEGATADGGTEKTTSATTSPDKKVQPPVAPAPVVASVKADPAKKSTTTTTAAAATTDSSNQSKLSATAPSFQPKPGKPVAKLQTVDPYTPEPNAPLPASDLAILQQFLTGQLEDVLYHPRQQQQLVEDTETDDAAWSTFHEQLAELEKLRAQEAEERLARKKKVVKKTKTVRKKTTDSSTAAATAGDGSGDDESTSPKRGSTTNKIKEETHHDPSVGISSKPEESPASLSHDNEPAPVDGSASAPCREVSTFTTLSVPLPLPSTVPAEETHAEVVTAVSLSSSTVVAHDPSDAPPSSLMPKHDEIDNHTGTSSTPDGNGTSNVTPGATPSPAGAEPTEEERRAVEEEGGPPPHPCTSMDVHENSTSTHDTGDVVVVVEGHHLLPSRDLGEGAVDVA